jgi:hypothetical protein
VAELFDIPGNDRLGNEYLINMNKKKQIDRKYYDKPTGHYFPIIKDFVHSEASGPQSLPEISPAECKVESQPIALPANLLPGKLDDYTKKLAELMERALEEAEKRYPYSPSILHLFGFLLMVLSLSYIPLIAILFFSPLGWIPICSLCIAYARYFLSYSNEEDKRESEIKALRRAFVAAALLHPESLNMPSLDEARKQLEEAESDANDIDEMLKQVDETQNDQDMLEEAMNELEGERNEEDAKH